MAGSLDADLLHRCLLTRRSWYVGEFDADLDVVDPIALEGDDARVLGGAEVPGLLVHRGNRKIALQDGVNCRLPALFVLALQVVPDWDFTPHRIANHEARFHRIWQTREQRRDEERKERCTKKRKHYASFF